MRSAAVLLFTCACGASTVDATLAEIQPFSTMDVYLAGENEPSRAALLLVLGYTPREPDDCPRLGDDTQAFVDDVPLARVSLGQAEHSFDMSSCSHPSFVIERREDLPHNSEQLISTFQISDASATWSMRASSPFLERGFAALSDPIAAGDRVGLSWAVGSDQISIATVDLIQNDRTVFELSSVRMEIERTESGFAFQMPAGVAAGAATLRVTTDARASLLSCEGALRCSLWLPSVFDLPIVVR